MKESLEKAKGVPRVADCRHYISNSFVLWQPDGTNIAGLSSLWV